jgi:hypothetical protein
MAEPFTVVELSCFKWPRLSVPVRRFRLFVAADLRTISTDEIADFARNALSSGMVYICAWGPDCERLHDVVDEIVVADEIGERRFVGPTESDTIMTTWHNGETLDDALEFFLQCSRPTEGFAVDSEYWLALSLSNPEWAGTIQRSLQESSRPK